MTLATRTAVTIHIAAAAAPCAAERGRGGHGSQLCRPSGSSQLLGQGPPTPMSCPPPAAMSVQSVEVPICSGLGRLVVEPSASS